MESQSRLCSPFQRKFYLGMAVLVAHEDHGDAVGQQQRGRQVAHLALAQPQHPLQRRVPLRAAVPAQVVVLPVPGATP